MRDERLNALSLFFIESELVSKLSFEKTINKVVQ